MKVSLNWLHEFVSFEEKPEKTAHLLTMSGLEVSEITHAGDDFILEVEVTSNRPDCLSIIGVARELSVLLQLPLKIPQPQVENSKKRTAEFTSVEIVDKELCPRYTAQIITGIEITESPEWLKNRLEALDIRPVNNVVDITNYVSMETGQPLHAFDFDKLNGKKIIVRRAKKDETITAINGKPYPLDNSNLVIADAEKAVAIAGVIGGIDSEVKSETKHILLESAFFDPVSVRNTSRALKLTTSASFRFERGVDTETVLTASLRATQLIHEVAGGEIASLPIDVNYMKIEKTEVSMRFKRFDAIMNFAISPDKAVKTLNLLGLETVKKTDDTVTVSVPPRRKDIGREIDLIEELARIEGLDKAPVIDINARAVQTDKTLKEYNQLKQMLRSFGFYETLTESFVIDSPLGRFSAFNNSENLSINNPVKPETPFLRKSLIPNLIFAYKKNQDEKVKGINLFEISNVYLPRENALPEEVYLLSFITEAGFLEAKGVVESVLHYFRLTGKGAFVPGKFLVTLDDETAKILLDSKPVGFLGTICPNIKNEMDIKENITVCELLLPPILESGETKRKYQLLPKYPKITRDLAVIINENISWQEIKNCVKALDIDILETVDFFDVYSGKQVSEGKKSIAFSLQFGSSERTLTNEEVDSTQKIILNQLQAKFSAELRK
ncbi:MAG: phenylalanine--tRNA ligase subunit beta [Planctomycetota bacterium]